MEETAALKQESQRPDYLPWKDHKHLIGGEWIDSTSDERITIINPATEEAIGTIPVGTGEDVNKAVAAAQKAHELGHWRKMPVADRARIVRRVGEIMMRRRDEIARAETIDQGRPIRQSQGMIVPLAASAWDFMASALMTFHGTSVQPAPWASGYTLHQPIGVVGAITPGNVPLVLGSEKLSAALAAGNAAILKPPPDCPIASVLFVECIVEAGVPEGVINLVLGDGITVGKALGEHPNIGMIAFTGSTNVGKLLMQQASVNVKRLLLELGGKAPQVVFADADVDAAVEGAMWGAYLNGGQICMASTRILVHHSIYNEFSEKFVKKTEKLRIGPGINPESDLGPMVSDRIRDNVVGYIQAGKAEGATVLTGGDLLDQDQFEKGYWVQPTIFTGIRPDMSIWRDEIFGPVPVLETFETQEEAIRLANDTPYGLTGSVWTNDLRTALTMAEEVDAGYVWINDHLIRAPGLPFGGWKQSGYGREAAADTLKEFTNTKSVFFDRTGMSFKPRYKLVYPG
jgi:acyl-CoA reductase-like NAD-dependent aldehyde dehydrogenase